LELLARRHAESGIEGIKEAWHGPILSGEDLGLVCSPGVFELLVTQVRYLLGLMGAESDEQILRGEVVCGTFTTMLRLAPDSQAARSFTEAQKAAINARYPVNGMNTSADEYSYLACFLSQKAMETFKIFHQFCPQWPLLTASKPVAINLTASPSPLWDTAATLCGAPSLKAIKKAWRRVTENRHLYHAMMSPGWAQFFAMLLIELIDLLDGIPPETIARHKDDRIRFATLAFVDPKMAKMITEVKERMALLELALDELEFGD